MGSLHLPEGATWRGGELSSRRTSSGEIEQFSALNQKFQRDVFTEKGLVVDNQTKTLVSLIIPPTAKHFCIKDPGPFREILFKKGRLPVVVERRGSSDPEWRWVEQIDGRVMVLKSPLNYTPAEGACVQVLLGIDTHFFDALTVEKVDREIDRYRWF